MDMGTRNVTGSRGDIPNCDACAVGFAYVAVPSYEATHVRLNASFDRILPAPCSDPAMAAMARRDCSRSPPPKLSGKLADGKGTVLRATFTTLSGATIETTIHRSATLRDAQRILCGAFGHSDGFEVGVVMMDGRVFTGADVTPFQLVPDGARITVVFKRKKLHVVRRAF